MKSLHINEIKEILPHRHPFLLLDRIEDYEPGQYAIGYKCVTYREDFFAGIFRRNRLCRCTHHRSPGTDRSRRYFITA